MGNDRFPQADSDRGCRCGVKAEMPVEVAQALEDALGAPAAVDGENGVDLFRSIIDFASAESGKGQVHTG
ncbi:hypothetical protein [Streptomyces syringium]|uniref:hypothetical protein n=1 Tax=Streptomyces syringium TaxID=76729 RepID=UPI0034512EA0